MAKRFTDTEKWKDPWFRKLQPYHKAIWEFLRDNVDVAGFWKVDLEYLQFHVSTCNCPGSYPEKKTLFEALNEGKERIKDHGDHWQLTDFVFFQNGHLRADVKPHKPILNLLEKYQNKGYLKGINTLEGREREKEKEKDFGKPENLFEKFWEAYPKKRSKGKAEKAWKALKPNELLQDRILGAIEKAKISVEWQKDGGQFIPYPATWLNSRGWEDTYEIEVKKNPLNLNKTQMKNMEALGDFLERKGKARPEDIFAGDSHTIRRIPGSQSES